ncbi:MAG: DNA adenine methylase [Oscillospiraceae bacterium]
MGNKTSILKIIYALFPLKYNRYIEPFGGSGAVLLGKENPDKFEVYNDYNHNLVNLFNCMRDRPLAFIRELGFLTLNSRDDFNAIKKFFKKEEFSDEYLSEESELTKILLPNPNADEIRELYKKSAESHDLRRGAMFLKLLRFSYSSGGKRFACQPFSVANLFTLVQDLSQRMKNVVIENQDFEVLIKHYDRIDSFFYCDPPYFTSEYVYSCGFSWEDHLRLFTTLENAKGMWLVSYNDCPEIRELYKGYHIFEFKRVHSMVQKYEAGKEFPEILIANFDIFEKQRCEPLQMTLFQDENIDYEKILKETYLKWKITI